MEYNSDGHNGFARMQHLINEMSASNHRIDLFSQKYDDGEEKVGIDSPSEPCRKTSSMDRQFDALYDDAWRSEDSDRASLQEILCTQDAEDSGCEEVVNSAIAEVSNDFLSGVRQHNLCADSDESRISSDNDGKLYGFASYARYPETATGLSDTDWNPYGTESDNNQSPRLQIQENASDSKCSILTSFTPLLNSTDINTVTPNCPIKLSPESGERMSDILEQTERDSTLSHQLIPNSTDTPLRPIYTPVKTVIKKRSGEACSHEQLPDMKEKNLSSSKESVSSSEDKKFMASTSSTGYSSAVSATKPETVTAVSASAPLSVIERAKLLGIPESILLDKDFNNSSSKTSKFHQKYSQDNYVEFDDPLGKKVQALLSDTTHLSMYDNSSNVDYTVLQRDLQEIQDNLDNFALDTKESLHTNKQRAGSDGEGDIIPSTTTTPEKRKEKMIWDFAGDVGTLGGREGLGLMGEISLDTLTTGSQRPSTEKPLYNSDGDETRTSESSTKNEDHVAADLALAEMSEILHPSLRDLNSSTDVDRIVSNFQDKRKQLESRYQQLNNQGLADKVFRILTNQDPESQANGILSEVHNDENNMRTRFALNAHDKNFNYSSTSSWLDDRNQSFNRQCEVRKKLDLSGVSSVDSSWMLDKSASEGFSALDGAKRLLSSQMMKASERTFNNSIEVMRVPPQTILCYPLLADNSTGNGNSAENEVDKKDENTNVNNVADYGATASRSQENEVVEGITRSPANTHEDEMRNDASPNSSDQGASTSLRPKDKYRPYRPPGSSQVYYTESDTASVADSATTMESTHIGSDDARGPSLPSYVLGSRKDPPNAAGIYSSRNLSTVCEDTELGTIDEKNENNSTYKGYLARGTGNSSTEETKRRSYYSAASREFVGPSNSRKEEKRSDDLEKEHCDRNTGMAGHGIVHYRPEEKSSTSGISAARREARWANRRDEVSRDSSYQAELSGAPQTSGMDRPDDWKTEFSDKRQRYSSLSDLKDKGEKDDKDIEPLSLRIQMVYTDDKKMQENDSRYTKKEYERNEIRDGDFISDYRNRIETEHHRERDVDSFVRHDLDSRARLSPTLTSAALYKQQEMFRGASDDEMYSGANRLSPAFRSALSPGREGRFPRTASDEDLNLRVRDARLSTAFRRALSPELRSAIERRSPLLSRHLERSLAQPPSEYPLENRMDDPGFDTRNQRPMFLARERLLSPTEYSRSRPLSKKSNRLSPNRQTHTRPRDRSPSPTLQDRMSQALIGSQRRSPSPTLQDRMSQEIPGSRRRSPSPTLQDRMSQEIPGSRRRSPSPTLQDRMSQEIPVSRRRSPSPTLQDRMSQEIPGSRRRSPSPVLQDRMSLRHTSPNGKREKDVRQVESVSVPGRRVLNSQNRLSPSPKRKVELTLEKMSSGSEADLDMDQEPLSKRAQLLKSALSNEKEPCESQNLNTMWEKFMNDSGSSSINSSKIEAVSNLLKSPSCHIVSQYMRDREEYRIERQERAEVEKERRLKEQKAQKQSSSEEEINERYAELLARKEGERLKRRALKKRKGKGAGSVPGSDKKTENDILFSIPEDRSHDPSPAQSNTPSRQPKSTHARQAHLIDPDMFKLREKISKQKSKVDKDILKEMRRIEKLKTLEGLLLEKKKGKISNDTLEKQLEELSSTSAVVSDLSHESSKENHLSKVGLSDDSTTAKDSSAEMHAWKAEKERRRKVFEMEKQAREEQKCFKEKSNHKVKRSLPSHNQPCPDMSEIRLLKLVKDGYLTPDEAYKLAMNRATLDSFNSSHDSSMNNDKENNGKPHKYYSPYSRYSSSSSHMRHVPKLKFSDSIPHSTYGLDDMESKPAEYRGRKSQQPSHSHEQILGFKKGKERRPKSYSPSLGRHKVSDRGRHTSPSPTRREYSASPVGKGASTGHYSRKPKKGISKKYNSENDSSEDRKGQSLRESVAWHIPVDLPPSQWNEPLPKQPLREITSSNNNSLNERYLDSIQNEAEKGIKERQQQEVPSIWTSSSHPAGIPKLEWEQVVRRDALATKTNHWEVDPLRDRVQYILNKPDSQGGHHSERSVCEGDSDYPKKFLSKLSLQEAFTFRKQTFISKSSERQKRMKLAKEDRQLQECLRLEREAIFAEHERLAPPNLYAHPYSDNLYQPKHRVFTKQEMKSLTAKRYSKLPEVVEKKEETRKHMESKLNRLRASLFNKKVQRGVLQKQRC